MLLSAITRQKLKCHQCLIGPTFIQRNDTKLTAGVINNCIIFSCRMSKESGTRWYRSHRALISTALSQSGIIKTHRKPKQATECVKKKKKTKKRMQILSLKSEANISEVPKDCHTAWLTSLLFHRLFLSQISSLLLINFPTPIQNIFPEHITQAESSQFPLNKPLVMDRERERDLASLNKHQT